MKIRSKLCYLSILVIILISFFISPSFAYSNDIFSIDVPDSFDSLKTANYYIFANDEVAVLVLIKKDSSKKKDLNSIKMEDFEQLLNSSNFDNLGIITSDKTEIGKYKCLHFLAKAENDEFFDMYYTYSDNYIYCVGFSSKDRNILNSSEIVNIRNSFKIKDTISSKSPVLLIIVIIAIIIIFILLTRKRK